MYTNNYNVQALHSLCRSSNLAVQVSLNKWHREIKKLESEAKSEQAWSARNLGFLWARRAETFTGSSQLFTKKVLVAASPLEASQGKRRTAARLT
jgi:hypothetical protein